MPYVSAESLGTISNTETLLTLLYECSKVEISSNGGTMHFNCKYCKKDLPISYGRGERQVWCNAGCKKAFERKRKWEARHGN